MPCVAFWYCCILGRFVTGSPKNISHDVTGTGPAQPTKSPPLCSLPQANQGPALCVRAPLVCHGWWATHWSRKVAACSWPHQSRRLLMRSAGQACCEPLLFYMFSVCPHTLSPYKNEVTCTMQQAAGQLGTGPAHTAGGDTHRHRHSSPRKKSNTCGVRNPAASRNAGVTHFCWKAPDTRYTL